MKFSAADRSILRQLAEQQARIAEAPVQAETARAWRRLNSRQPGRPLIWINEIPWNEMNATGELTLRCTDPYAREVEEEFRQRLYQWQHLPGNMIVEPQFYCPLVINDTGYGITEDVEIVKTAEDNLIVSREFHPQIREEADLEKIKTPVISLDAEASAARLEALNEAFGDILPIQQVGIVHWWFAPWDELIRWWGIQEAMTDLYLRPELVHAAMDRLVTASLARIDQWERLNLLSVKEGNYRVGSGGLAYSEELPREGFNPARVRARDQWGFSTAQIFCDISPEMHEEFALRYERRWLERFGLNYYGCCEPLHLKIGMLASVPNLRKISMSPWANIERMVEAAGDKYVLSYKPNPALLAGDRWNPEAARLALRDALEKAQGCALEIIMKDISTVCYEPQRLWDWARIAMEEADRCGG